MSKRKRDQDGDKMSKGFSSQNNLRIRFISLEKECSNPYRQLLLRPFNSSVPSMRIHMRKKKGYSCFRLSNFENNNSLDLRGRMWKFWVLRLFEDIAVFEA